MTKEKLKRLIDTPEGQEKLEQFVEREVYVCQSSLVDELIQKEFDGFNYDNIVNLYQTEDDIVNELVNYRGVKDDDLEDEIQSYRDNGEDAQEIYEWWIVSNWMADKLEHYGEPILKNDYGTWWGRTATGQAILLDAVIEIIYQNLN